MSAVAVVCGDGAAPRRLQLALAALAGRLERPKQLLRDGAAALGGEAVETLGPLSVAADARLYNRPELLAVLRQQPDATDAAVILAAYAKWGSTCAAHLLGDFAFAIWDSARSVLFCARDHFGVRPFVYANIEGAFVFASTTKAVRAATGLNAMDEGCIGDFLAGFIADHNSTPYLGVQRLAPACTLSLVRGAVKLAPYWRIPDQAEAAPKAAAEEFKALFQSAVRARVSPSAGVMLSGGLDSSSIALTAARLERTQSFSTVFANSPDERVYIDAAVRSGNLAPHYLIADDRSPFDGFERVLDEQDGLFLAPGIAGVRALYGEAARMAQSALLDGHGGDEVVSHGRGQLRVSARAGAWRDLWRYARAEANLYGGSRASVFVTYWLSYGPLAGALAKIRRARAHAMGGRNGFTPARLFVNAEFAAATGLDRRWRSARLPAFVSEAEHHRDLIAAPLQAHALEVLNNVSASAHVEARYPFWDKRVVEFCVRLPPEEKIGEAGTRSILRRALSEELPPAIRTRPGKFDFTGALAMSMCAHSRALLDEIFLSRGSRIAPYADVAALEAAYRRMTAKPQAAAGADVQAVWRGATLALWLDWRRRGASASSARKLEGASS